MLTKLFLKRYNVRTLPRQLNTHIPKCALQTCVSINLYYYYYPYAHRRPPTLASSHPILSRLHLYCRSDPFLALMGANTPFLPHFHEIFPGSSSQTVCTEEVKNPNPRLFLTKFLSVKNEGRSLLTPLADN